MTTQVHTLSNGFRIVSEYMPGLESASIGIWVAAGGRHESAAQNGLAHFLEHMAFKGTARRDAFEIANAIENVGGYLNAYTSREVTAYYARVLRADVPLALDVLADIVLNPAFDPGEIETERGVILQEIGQALDTPDDVIFDWLQEQAFPDQAIGRTILGTSEHVSSFGRDDLVEFVQSRYRPDQMILSAAGAVDHDRLVALAADAFGHLSSEKSANIPAARFVGGQARQNKALEQAHVAIGFSSPNYRDDAIYTAQIYASALGGGMSSRLFQEVREKRGLCYSIFAQAGAYCDAGLTTIYAGTSAAQVGDLSRLIIDEMKRASQLSLSELERARAQMKAGMLMGLESPSNRAERLARLLQIWGRVPPLGEIIEKIDAVDVPMLQEYAAHMACDAPMALALYGPIETAPERQELQSQREA